jgi:hypothetical protein
MRPRAAWTDRETLKACGGFLVVCGAFIALVALFTHLDRRGVPHQEILLVPAAGFVAVGLGAMALRLWAVVLAVAMSLAVGVWLIVGSLLHVPFPYCLINVALGAVACLPAVAALRGRAALKVP